jgi:hypothetical protein
MELAGGRMVDVYCVFLPGEPASHAKDSAWLYQFMTQDFTFCHRGLTQYMNTHTHTERQMRHKIHKCSGTSGSAVYFCLPNNNPMYIQYLREMVPPSIQNMGSRGVGRAVSGAAVFP